MHSAIGLVKSGLPLILPPPLFVRSPMAKSRIGPFALEAPLTPPKSSGQLFRGIHVEQRKLAALRVFPIPMGLTPESRQAYATQLEQLKQLRHPGIVRCYGGGFDSRNAFLAYELIDGESLSSLLARRDRLPWETALEFSQQLAAALEHAHALEWVHGRLSPTKVLVGRDGVVKLADFRRDAIASMIEARPSLVQVQYAAPEVVQGGLADEKSDLYSLGAVMYTLLTGQPPFAGQDEAETRRLITTAEIPSVGASVLDCPVWLTAIVEQLLAKDPKLRPFSTTALRLAFKEAQRRQAQGVGVLQHATAGFSPLQLKADRNEAEKLLGLQPKKKKKQSETSIFESAWVLLLGLVLAVGATIWFLLPLGEATLRARAEQLLASDQWLDWNEARDSYLQALVTRFPDSQAATWASEQIEWVDAREAERRLDRDERLGRKDNWSQAQIQYAEARKFERFGDLATAMDKFRAIISLFANQPEDQAIVFLASEAIQRIREQGLDENSLPAFLTSKLAEAQAAYDDARIADAKLKWESIIELYAGNQEVQPLVDEARRHLDELN